jgi:hypothetical protein
LIDSGAVYSLALPSTLKKLGICPLREVDFTLADGTTITRRVGDAYFELGREGGAAPVIFGKKGRPSSAGRDHPREHWINTGSIQTTFDSYAHVAGLTGAAVSKPPGRFGNRPSVTQGISRLALLTRTSFQSHGFAD